MASAALGTVARVTVEPANGGRPVTCYAPADWARRLRRAPDPPPRIRVLAPFDPIVHDRRRTQRLFGFDYRFEAFVPAARRRHGYYVLPILEGDRLVGRMDPLPRKNGGRVQARRVWWEAGIRPTRARRRGLTAALERLTACIETAD